MTRNTGRRVWQSWKDTNEPDEKSSVFPSAWARLQVIVVEDGDITPTAPSPTFTDTQALNQAAVLVAITLPGRT